MAKRIWTVADGQERPPIAFFSSRDGAERYTQVLLERYSLGKTLALHGKPLARDAGAWQLGFGPQAFEHPIDEPPDRLPGAWIVKVDEDCRMVACEFSLIYRPTKSPNHFRTGIHAICQAYGATPHGALDSARKGMVSYLSKPPTWR